MISSTLRTPIACAPSRSDCIAEQVPIAAGVVKDRLDARLLLDQDRGGQRAHPRARPRAVGNVDEVDAADLELARLLDQRVGLEAARRHQLDADDESAARERVGHPRLLRAGDGRHRLAGAAPAAEPPPAGTVPRARRAPASAPPS